MKEFISKYKKTIVAISVFWGILLVLFLTNLGISLVQTGKYINRISHSADSSEFTDIWGNAEIRNLEKEKIWLDQQIQLAKTDSFSLGINLHDSVLQVQLKGTVLFQAKILHQKPTRFFSKIDKATYMNLFGNVARIDSFVANASKRPIKKVQAPPVGVEQETVKKDTVIVEPIHWTFSTTNHIRVVVNGVIPNADSTYTFYTSKDVFDDRYKHAFKNPLKKEFNATLYLWMNDTDAKAIYRALPERAKFIFRN